MTSKSLLCAEEVGTICQIIASGSSHYWDKGSVEMELMVFFYLFMVLAYYHIVAAEL